MIKTVNKVYLQKSRTFLYPLLGIKRGVSVTPIQIYMAWKGYYKAEDYKLITHYHLRDDQEFKMFEQQKLLGNELYHDFKQVGSEEGVYVFDFTPYTEDWNNILQGKYSKLSESNKQKILSFFGNNSENFAHAESFLYPEKYFKLYAELMAVDIYHLKKVGELCDKPNLEKETLDMAIINLDIIKKIT